jgi:hypothetical protein
MSAHTCHWPGCKVEVPPRLWGCREHWFRLPKAIRDRIWATYVPGQEVRKDPSAAYLAVAAEAERYARTVDSALREIGDKARPTSDNPLVDAYLDHVTREGKP